MKKILLTVLLISSTVFAFEDYMVISTQPVKSVRVNNPEILDSSVLFTIDNQKKDIILTPKKVGKTKITVELYNQTKRFDVKVTENKTFIDVPDGFYVFLMDSPPKAYPIPKPPVYKEKK